MGYKWLTTPAYLPLSKVPSKLPGTNFRATLEGHRTKGTGYTSFQTFKQKSMGNNHTKRTKPINPKASQRHTVHHPHPAFQRSSFVSQSTMLPQSPLRFFCTCKPLIRTQAPGFHLQNVETWVDFLLLRCLIESTLMVNWWFGARWFGFLSSPYERDCYERGRIPNHRAPNYQLTIG